MTPDASFYQFSKVVWQLVNDQARQALVRKEFSPDDARIESVRCVHLEEEGEMTYGRQVWFFEATAYDAIGRQHRLFGALDFSVQYALLVPMRAMLMDEPQHRQRFLQSIVHPYDSQVWVNPSTKIWVRLTLASVILLSATWLLSLAACLMET
ncbi:MAG: hypothetical protein R3C09_04420 [Pirellulaceae bacterium]|jgi:hypothetical protein